MNTKILKIALNNVLKHKRRTIFNALTFAINAVALIMLLGLLKGMYNAMYEKTIDMQTGHFKIYAKNYAEEKAKMSLNYTIKDPYKVMDDLKNISYFVGAAPQVEQNVVLSDTRNKVTVLMTGIDMEKELKITGDFDNIEGARLSGNSGQALIGRKLASMMGLKVGAELLLYAQTKDRANNLVDASLTGIYSIGFDFVERTCIFVPLKFAQDLLDIGDTATCIVVRIKDRSYVPFVKKQIEKILAEKYPGLTVRDWTQEAAALIAGAHADFSSYAVIFAILLFLAVFIIMNTLTITVFERTAEIGTLRAIGMESGQIGWMFFSEGLILALAGAIIGGIAAVPLAYLLNTHGIQLGTEAMSKMNLPMSDVIRGKNVWTDWMLVTAIMLITGAIGAIFPSNRAAKTNIVEALKKGIR